MKKSNNNISDWLDKHGDPEVDKVVEQELERITQEIEKTKDNTVGGDIMDFVCEDEDCPHCAYDEEEELN